MSSSSEYAFPIFVSSTDYKLVDLRAELARHLREAGYEPSAVNSTWHALFVIGKNIVCE